jgi:hypothetical protein
MSRSLFIFAISNSTANAIYSVASTVLVIGAVLTLLGTIGAIWSGGIREKFANASQAMRRRQHRRTLMQPAQMNVLLASKKKQRKRS